MSESQELPPHWMPGLSARSDNLAILAGPTTQVTTIFIKNFSKNFLKIPHQYIYIVLIKVTTDLTVNLLTMES